LARISNVNEYGPAPPDPLGAYTCLRVTLLIGTAMMQSFLLEIVRF